MQRYHIEVEGNLKYINMLKDAQKQAGRDGRTIDDKNIILFANNAMVKTERYSITNDDWKYQAEANKTCADWKTVYKKAHAKARVKAQATEGSDKFGAANATARVHNTSEERKKRRQ